VVAVRQVANSSRTTCRRIERIGPPAYNPTSRRDLPDLLQFHFFNQNEIRIELIAERAAASSLSILARQSRGPVVGIAGVKPDYGTVMAHDQPVSVMLDFVNPIGATGRF
jgi:hypothetical protein